MKAERQGPGNIETRMRRHLERDEEGRDWNKGGETMLRKD